MHEDIYNTHRIKIKENALKEIIKNTPGGMHVCHLSDPIHLEYASNGLVDMLGYTRKEFDEITKDFYLNNVPEEYHQAFFDFCLDLKSNIGTKEIEYEMITKNNDRIVVKDVMVSKLCDDNIIRGYSSVTDITALKRTQERLKEEHYALNLMYKETKEQEKTLNMIVSFSGIFFYEWDMLQDKFLALKNVKEVLLYEENEFRDLLDLLEEKNSSHLEVSNIFFLLHSISKKNISKLLPKLDSGEKVSENFRILCGDQNYHWFNAEIKRENNIELGLLRNIDEEIKILEELKIKRNVDTVTGFIDKKDAEAKINDILKKQSDKIHALVYLDMDNFSVINDNLGKDTGDLIIKKTSDFIRALFRKSDIFCRHEGDSFIIFCENIISKFSIIERMQIFNEKLSQCPYLEGTNIRLTASVGIAFSTRFSSAKGLLIEAITYADQVKNSGKNGILSKGDNEIY